MRGFCGLNRGQPQTRPPRRGCQSSRAALSTAAATGDTAAGNPQPPAGGCQSGIATATDSGPIPSATTTRATGDTAAGNPQPPAGGCQSGTATATDSRRAVSISTTAAGICPPPIPATDSGPGHLAGICHRATLSRETRPDSGPIPSATATRAAGARGRRNRDSPPGQEATATGTARRAKCRIMQKRAAKATLFRREPI